MITLSQQYKDELYKILTHGLSVYSGKCYNFQNMVRQLCDEIDHVMQYSINCRSSFFLREKIENYLKHQLYSINWSSSHTSQVMNRLFAELDTWSNNVNRANPLPSPPVYSTAKETLTAIQPIVSESASQSPDNHWLQVTLSDKQGSPIRSRDYLIYDKDHRKILHQGKTDGEMGMSEKITLSPKHNNVIIIFPTKEKWEEKAMKHSATDRVVEVTLETFTLTDIPSIMRANHWETGAQLMEQWFANPNYTYPDADLTNDPKRKYNDEIVTMAWAKGFPRAKKVYDAMWSDKIYSNQAAKTLLEDKLREKAFFVKNTTRSFGDLGQAINTINRDEEFYIQSREVGSHFHSIVNEWDGMHAALARFTFRMAIEGEVVHKGREDNFFDFTEDELYEVKIKRVGIYLRDSYDFIGNQFGDLGYWNKVDNTVAKTGGENFHKVTNADFRQWRDENDRGGDFTVYSDIDIREVNESWIIKVNH